MANRGTDSRVFDEAARFAGRSAAVFQRLVDDLKLLRYDTLFPMSRWLRDRPWELRSVQVLLFLALYPMAVALLFTGGYAPPRNLIWLFGLYFSLLWGAMLYRVVEPPRFATRVTVGVAAFTVLVGVQLLLAVDESPVLRFLAEGQKAGNPLVRLPSWILGVGLLEESCKVLPVLWLAFKTRQVSSPRDAAFYGGISGLAFGVAEAVTYAVDLAQGSRSDVNTYLLNQMVRMIPLPFLHCVWASIAGYYVGLAALSRRRVAALVLVGLGTSAVLHGVYDFLVPGWPSVVVFAGSILLFVSYARTADSISSTLRSAEAEAARLAAVPIGDTATAPPAVVTDGDPRKPGSDPIIREQ